jgi:limonene-1,2-epoxide hydrolase
MAGILQILTDLRFYVPFNVKAQGKDQILGLHKQFREAAIGFHIAVVSAHITRGYGTIEWIMSGTDTAVFGTGKPFSVRGVSIVEVRNGKINSISDYYDAATIMRQVGALPAADPTKH